jgi:hypothetical protein
MSLKSLARWCAPVLLSALAAASPASAGTIGHTGDGSQSCGAGTIEAEDSYASPTVTQITSFSVKTTAGNDSQQVDFLVLRPTSPGNYTVVGKSGTITLDGLDAVQTFAVTPIPVHQGDVLGWFNVTDHAGCVIDPGSGSFRGADDQSDPDVGSAVSLGSATSGFDLNLAAHFPSVTGSGNTNPATGFPPNAFSLSSITNTLTYAGGGRQFNGSITCLNIVDNAATIVAVDGATGFVDRTMVQDNGASGDKLLNTLADPSKVTAKSLAKLETCVSPDLTALAQRSALAGDAIQVG